jgi:arylsulfatase A-like enzyme
MADDIGVEGIGCYGGTSYATPNIDALAAGGLRFAHAHAQPLCTNTRLQLMTGLHNNRNWMYFGILPPDSKTIGHYLGEAGYQSCIAGKWQLQSYDPPDFPGAELRRGTGMHPNDAGFDRYSLFHSLHTEDKGSRYADPTWLEDGELKTAKGKYGPDMWVDYINSFMAQQKDSDDPFFVYWPMALPHWPMTLTPDSADWDSKPEERLTADTKNFKDMVEYMDKCVGKVVKQIDDLGIRDNTIIIFYSDNGTHLDITPQTKDGPVKGGKAMPTDAGTHVPLIVNWPKRVLSGVSQWLVDSVDFIPTLLDIAGQPLPKVHKLDGISFYPRCINPVSNAPHRKAIYSYYDPRPGWDKDRFRLHVSARDRRWKLYQTGKLYDIDADILEQQPILAENDTEETSAVRSRLQEVLEANAVK